MSRFKVTIKQETIEEMPFMKKLGIDSTTEYDVVDKIEGRLILHIGNGEMVEVYPRKCLLVEDFVKPEWREVKLPLEVDEINKK